MKTNPERQTPKSKSSSRGGIPVKKIKIRVVPTEKNPRFATLCGDLHYLGATRPIGHFLRQVAVVDGEWIASSSGAIGAGLKTATTGGRTPSGSKTNTRSRIRKHNGAHALASLKNLAIGLHALGVFNTRKSPCKTIPKMNRKLARNPQIAINFCITPYNNRLLQ